jgi:hypothetical protein
MQAVRKRRQAQQNAAIRQAWETAAFTAMTQSRSGLKPLRHYLSTAPRSQTPEDMLAVMREFQARGAKMTFTRVKRDHTAGKTGGV